MMDANSAGKVGIKQFVIDLFYTSWSFTWSSSEAMQRQLPGKQSLTQPEPEPVHPDGGRSSTCSISEMDKVELRLPSSADSFLAGIQREMHEAQAVFHDSLAGNEDVRLLNKDRGWISLSP